MKMGEITMALTARQRQLERVAEMRHKHTLTTQERKLLQKTRVTQILKGNQEQGIKLGLSPSWIPYVLMRDHNIEPELELVWYQNQPFPVSNPKYTGRVHVYPRALMNTMETHLAADRSYMVKCDMVLYPGCRAGVWGTAVCLYLAYKWIKSMCCHAKHVVVSHLSYYNEL